MPEFLQRSFSSGEIAPNLHARADLTKYLTGLATCLNFKVLPEGGVESRAGSAWVGEIKGSTFRLIPFQFNVSDAYVLELTNLSMRVIRNGGYVVEADSTITGVSQASPAVVTDTGHGYSDGDQIYISMNEGMVELHNGWYTVANKTTNTYELSGVDSSGYTAYTSGGTSNKIYTVASPFAEADLDLLKYTQSADVMTFTHPSYDPSELTRTAHDAWTFTTASYAPTLAAPTGAAVAGGGNNPGTGTRNYEYVVTAVDADGVESLASTSATASLSTLSTTYYAEVTWNSVTDADHYNIYKADSEVSDYYGYLGRSETTSYRDFNLRPDITDTPPLDRQPFNGADNKPSTLGYYQQRIVFGRTNNKIQTVYTSQSGNYKSLRKSEPTRDDDAVTFTIASSQVNEIRHIVSLKELLILTSGGEWLVTEGQDEVLTPSTVGVRLQSTYGTSHVKPVLVGDAVVVIQERGSRVRDLSYAFESDSYAGSDLSILSQHLMRGHTLVDAAYAQEPNNIIWYARSDGKVLGLTYHREHQVVGWHVHDFGGNVKSLAVINEGQESILYIGVERTVNGVTKYYTERMKARDWATAEDAFCVDSGLTYSGSSATVISGLRHLEGESVSVLADGNVVKGLTVSDGKLTIPDGATKVHIGIGFNADFETLDLDAADLAVRGKKKSVSEVTLKFQDSRGGFVGPNSSTLKEIRPRLASDNYDNIALRTYESRQAVAASWNSGGRVFFRQSDPLPVTILAVQPNIDVG